MSNDLGEFMLVEHCQRLNVRDLTKQAKSKAMEVFLNSSMVVLGQGIKLTTTPCHFGGIRYWLICPQCGKRAGTLYKKPLGHLLFCRECHNLSYVKTRYHKML